MRKRKKIVWRLARPIVLQCENGAVKFVLMNYSTQVFQSLRLVIIENGIWVSPGHLPSRQARRKSEPQDVHTVMCTFTFFHNSGRELMPSNDCFWRKKDAVPHCWPRFRKWYACVLNPTPDPGETGVSVNSTAPWGQHVVKLMCFKVPHWPR